MVHNFDKSINELFHHTLRDKWKFFSYEYSTFWKQIATALLQKSILKYCKSMRHLRHSILLTVGTCALVFKYITRAHLQ